MLGKALFWDMQLGSDGITACASCHFHAGTDPRIKNQLTPGGGNGRFDFGGGGSNYTLRMQDFPFHKLSADGTTVERSVDDVASSQGVFNASLVRIVPGLGEEVATPGVSPLFRVGGVSTRAVATRNTPTVINAVFNLRNFWDGRAREIFNGRSPFGPMDRNARIIVVGPGGVAQATQVAIDNSSLASQAIGPPLSTLEMSFGGRHWPAIGRKMLVLRPLAKQLVDTTDSVLGRHCDGRTRGLRFPNYRELVKAAFQPKYWSSDARANVNGNGDLTTLLGAGTASDANYSIMEFNFSLFFGLAVQAYEATLVSSGSPFERYTASLGREKSLSDQQIEGLKLFVAPGKGRCSGCHSGKEFTEAAATLVAALQTRNFALRANSVSQGVPTLFERGFFNIGVRPTAEDPGVGGADPSGQPLSFISQTQLGINRGFTITLTPPLGASEPTAVKGAFKVPTLHNIELTGPYFHNGSVATLEDLMDFYDRGGNFRGSLELAGRGLGKLGLTVPEKAALVAFMKSLTDPRVTFERAPFDHPQLCVPNGHPGDQLSIIAGGFYGAADSLVEVAMVGRAGSAQALPDFKRNLEQGGYLKLPCTIPLGTR